MTKRARESVEPARVDDQELYAGLIRLHILHHAAVEPIFGLAIIEELARHGYRLSPGTLYPLLHGLEAKGYLHSSVRSENGRRRRFYRATLRGRRSLADAKEKVRELFSELFEELRATRRPRASTGRARSRRSR
jgi:DNA-binding PadR family transcriptional regulator